MSEPANDGNDVPFVSLMRRYCIDYTNSHDLNVCDEIMSPAYTLHMGGHDLTGRDEFYKPAVLAQYRQFPTLGLVTHSLVTDGDRLAMHFSEHGASRRHGGALAAWSGIGVYRWDGAVLTENWVEQDYYSRRTQLERGKPGELRAPGLDPWQAQPESSEARTIEIVERWLHESRWLNDACVELDDGAVAVPTQPRFDVHAVTVDDLFSAGRQAAFHVTITGEYLGGLDALEPKGQIERHYAAGIVKVSADDAVESGHVVSDRLGLWKRLAGGGT